MPKRTGLGKRGLDLLISASGGSVESDTDSGTASGMKSTGKKRTPNSPSEKKQLTGTGSTSGKAASGKGSGKKLRTEPKADQLQEESFVGNENLNQDQLTDERSASAEEVKSARAAGEFSEGASKNTAGSPVMVPVSLVEPNREQPRKNFDEDALQELAESIKQFGIIQPLIVQKREDYYEIIAGERRWRAARIASLKEVPVIIRDYTPKEIMEISLIENIQREDLNPIEEAAAYRRLIEEYQMKQDEVAVRVSKSRAVIANSIRLLNLDKRVQDMVISEMISAGHARALLAITDQDLQFQAAQKVFDEKLTVRDVEKMVRKMNEAPPSQVRKQISDALQAVYDNLAEQMKTSLGTKVLIAPKNAQKGKIEIEYYSSDELDRLCTLLNSIPQKEGV